MHSILLESTNKVKDTSILNVVSGKGGTGKTLLCAVLSRLLAQESAKVLLVDFDLYVRGLSYFHYIFIKEKRQITKNLTTADLFGLSTKTRESENLAIERFYEVDILPAVSEIEQELNYLKVEQGLILKVRSIFDSLRKDNYDYIIIDNRAGVDELIIETSRLSDITISVSESDPLAQATNENLLRHLKSNHVGKVYTIINKIKFLKSHDDYEHSMGQIRSDFTLLGKIPFDIDLFERFGSTRFWDNVNSTRYAYALSDTWNKLAQKETLQHTIDMKRFRINDLWLGKSTPTLLTLYERMSIITGILFIVSYYLYDMVLEGGEFHLKDMLILYAVIFLLFPVIRRFIVIRKD